MNPKGKISVLEIPPMVHFLITRGEMHIALILIFKMGGENAIMSVSTPPRRDGLRRSLPRHFLREITIMKELQHDNVATLIGIAVGRNFACTYLILEYYPYDLSKVIDDDVAKPFILHPESRTPGLVLHTTVAGKCPSSPKDEQEKQEESRNR
ncbi:hypothetical protein TNCV_1620171 [Trichonephila clavipes]|nr:hypothetical protein TNCV_1620171 [Trichonephila clavipes]